MVDELGGQKSKVRSRINSFEAICKLASEERWCWNLHCTTCGHLLFRYALLEIANGKSPDSPDWIIHMGDISYRILGAVPYTYSDAQIDEICKVCKEAILANILNGCKFPDSLGYLGLVLAHMQSDSEAFKELSLAWTNQLLELVPKDSIQWEKLAEHLDISSTLSWKDLEGIERIMLLSRYSRRK